MKYNIHAGHNPAGTIACGAVGILDESKENRRVKAYLIDFLREQGHTVYDCTCDNGTSQNDVLKKIVAKCNAHSGIDCDISLHLNAGGGHGTECEIYGTGGNAEKYAKKIQAAIVKRTGYTDRGVKVRKDLYVLRKTVSPAVLVECCFVDSAADAKQWNPQTMAAAICEGLTGVNPLENQSGTQTESAASTELKEEKIVYKTINDVPEWYRPTIEKLVADGSLVGTGNGELNLSDDICRVLVILDRRGKL